MPFHLARCRRICSLVPPPDCYAKSYAAAQGHKGGNERADVNDIMYQCGIISDEIRYQLVHTCAPYIISLLIPLLIITKIGVILCQLQNS
jgi:hypothetical protein